MAILNASNLGVTYGARDIFSDIHFELPADARVGLVGPNGVGKTSLFRVITGLLEPEAGALHLVAGTRIGYLAQEAVEAFAGHDHSLFDEMLTVFAPLKDQEVELRAMEAEMAAGDVGDELLERYGEAQERYQDAGGYDYDVRIRQTLDGLGFGRDQWTMPIAHLSGGEKTRALLARLLLERPNLLILDEPTNHLDVQAIEWLERALRNWPGALLMASHDRFFLDRVVDRIWEMSAHHIEVYRGGYSAYVQQRQERWERNQKIYESEMERIRAELELIRRYHAWRRFDEAWGKLKRLSRELVAIERWGLLGIQGKAWAEMDVHRVKMMTIEEAHDAIKRIKPPPGRPPQLHMRLRPSGRSGQIVLRTHDLQVGYGDKPLFDSDDIFLERLERVALIGPNGAGKTTFLRTLVGDLPPVSGTVTLGASLHIGYFAQAHDALDRDNTVLDELLRHRNLRLPEARNYLAQYLFRGDDVFKKVGALSGGERGRLALAVLTLEGINLLLLDEPTNHLDIPAREVLQEGLERFDGTIILVSHDRYLVSELASQIWEIRDGRLHVFNGTYAELVESHEANSVAVMPTNTHTRSAKSASQPSDETRRARDKERALSTLEEEIAQAEAALAAYSQQLETYHEGVRGVDISQVTRAYGDTQAKLERLLEEWAAVAS